MLRAGWRGGMLRASKLYQSVSTSGPSATVKPMPTNTSSRRSMVWVTRWRWPRRGAGHHLGEVEALGLQPRPARVGGQLPRRRSASGRLRAARGPSLSGPTRVPPLLRRQGAEAGLAGGQRRALAQHARSRAAAQLVERGGAGDGRRGTGATTVARGPRPSPSSWRASVADAGPVRAEPVARPLAGAPRSTGRRRPCRRSATRCARHRDGDQLVEPLGRAPAGRPCGLVAEHERDGRGEVGLGRGRARRWPPCRGAAGPPRPGASSTSTGLASATTGTWNSDPAEARTVFGLKTSTEPSQQHYRRRRPRPRRCAGPCRRCPGRARRRTTTTKVASTHGRRAGRRRTAPPPAPAGG